jgi:hypothetical protein
MTKHQVKRLEISGPTAQCGECHFGQALKGNWSVRNGLLTWTAMRDPLDGRGPDYHGCCESDHDGEGPIEFDVIETDGAPLQANDQAYLALVAARESGRKWEEDGQYL